MLLSMTGHGEAHHQTDSQSVSVELRTVNSRYFKLNLRTSDGYSSLEPSIEATLRKHVRRGTVQANVRIDRAASSDDYRLNEKVITNYRKQLESLYDHLHVADSIHLEALLSLPGVVDDCGPRNIDIEADWPIVEATLLAAVDNLTRMRQQEGSAMQHDLQANSAQIVQELEAIEQRAPLVVDGYRKRITERLKTLLAEYDVSVEASDIVREVGLFAERSDISEEIVRLRSHLGQFDSILQQDDSNGRKLEFLTQEMFRETNTIGSKSNDSEIAQHVIEIKTAIERIREMIQNVE